MKLRELERRLEEEPDNLGLRVAVAGALCEAGRQAEAVDLYRSVAIAYRDQGRAQQAIDVCRSALELAPDDARCRALQALLGELGVAPRGSPAPEAPAASRRRRASEPDLPATEDAPTRPGTEDGTLSQVSGIANAARRISATLIGVGAQAAAMRATIEPPVIPDPDDDDEDGRATAAGGTGGDYQYDYEDDDDQTQPRDLPMGVHRPGSLLRPPPVRPPSILAGAGSTTRSALAFAFFAPLPIERRAAVLSRFSRRSVPPGTVVIRQGEVAPSLVLVASGRLEVRADRAGAAIGIGAIGPGEHIGEAPLLSRTPSRVSVVAAPEAELLLLSPRDFYEVAGAFPALWAELKATAERRGR